MTSKLKVTRKSQRATPVDQQRAVSQRRILAELRSIQKLRKDNTQRELYGAEQALGWVSGSDYMNPANAFNP